MRCWMIEKLLVNSAPVCEAYTASIDSSFCLVEVFVTDIGWWNILTIFLTFYDDI